jgi:hypothetical protein
MAGSGDANSDVCATSLAMAGHNLEIDDPVGGLDDFEIVLDDEHSVAGLNQRVQYVEELADIVEMQPGHLRKGQ